VAVREDDYLLRTGTASVWPALTAPDGCPKLRTQPGTAPLVAIEPGSHPLLQWNREWRGTRQRFAELASSCWSAAFLRFARPPCWIDEQRILGDLRYDRSESLDFAEMRLPQAA